MSKLVRRRAEEYAEAFAALLPTGPAWPRDSESTLMRLLLAFADLWERVDGRAADLLEREGDPRTTIELLADWERTYGLPDDCGGEKLTIADRQKALTARVTMLGGQSIPFMKAFALALGYEVIIIEHAPFMVGVSRCGDTRTEPGGWHRWEFGPKEMRFWWTVKLVKPRLTWFRVGTGQVGVDPHLRIARATDLECALRRIKPAHTELRFDYSGIGEFGPMAGTP